jgi:ATP-binding cassette, subfamily B, bacterial
VATCEVSFEFRRTVRSFLRYFRPYRISLIPVVLASALEMFFNAQIPMSVKFIIDRALLGHNERIMVVVLAALAASTLLISVTSLARDYLYARIVGRIVSSLRERLFEHLQSLSMEFYARTEVGDVMSRFSNDIGSVETGLAAGVAWGLQPLLDLIISAVLVFSLEWRLAAFGMLLCPLCVLGPRLLARRATAASLTKQRHESYIMSSLQETLMAPGLLRAFNLQEPTVKQFRERNGQLTRASLRLGFMTSMMERSASFGTLLLPVFVMAISGLLAFHGTITVGTFASFQALFVSLSYSFMYLAQYTPNLITANGGIVRIEEILSEKPKVADVPGAIALSPLVTAIEVRDVTFGYNAGRPNVSHVSLRIARGKSVAFVGPSGSGKSTMLNLLMRFYDPDSGAILFDGVDLRRAAQASLRTQTAVVFQESFLFNTTIRENIRLARPGALDEEIVAAAKAAEIHDFISSLPEGYDTISGERGSRFSGGQRQRIAIARAVLKDPEILMLDEATSALDAASEHAINATLAGIARDRTVISVTHRLSSVVNMDCVFLFDHGSLMEQGSHSELLAAGGRYAELWRKQSGVQVGKGDERATVDAEWLAELPLMKGVSTATLAELARWFGTEVFREDRAIVQQGDPGDRFYVIARGIVEVTRLENGRSVRLAKLQDGDYFGEAALLRDQPRNATVRTLTPCVCLSLPRDLFNRLLVKEPELEEHIRAISLERALR